MLLPPCWCKPHLIVSLELHPRSGCSAWLCGAALVPPVPSAVPVLPSSALLGAWHSFSFCSSAQGWELPELPLPLPSPDSALAPAQGWAGPWHSHLRCSLAVPTAFPAQPSEPWSLCSSWTVFAPNPGAFIAVSQRSQTVMPQNSITNWWVDCTNNQAKVVPQIPGEIKVRISYIKVLILIKLVLEGRAKVADVEVSKQETNIRFSIKHFYFVVVPWHSGCFWNTTNRTPFPAGKLPVIGDERVVVQEFFLLEWL